MQQLTELYIGLDLRKKRKADEICQHLTDCEYNHYTVMYIPHTSLDTCMHACYILLDCRIVDCLYIVQEV